MKKSILITLLAFMALFTQAQTNRYLKMSDTLSAVPPQVITKAYLEKHAITASPTNPQNANIKITGGIQAGTTIGIANGTYGATLSAFGLNSYNTANNYTTSVLPGWIEYSQGTGTFQRLLQSPNILTESQNIFLPANSGTLISLAPYSSNPTAPTSTTAVGKRGEVRYDSSQSGFIFICVQDNQWLKVAVLPIL